MSANDSQLAAAEEEADVLAASFADAHGRLLQLEAEIRAFAGGAEPHAAKSVAYTGRYIPDGQPQVGCCLICRRHESHPIHSSALRPKRATIEPLPPTGHPASAFWSFSNSRAM